MNAQEFRNRGRLLMVIFAGILFIFSIRLFYIQVISEEYALEAESVDLKDIVLIPSRGIIYDRHERIYVKNSPIYDIEFIPKKITIPDTTVLEKYLGMDRAEIRKLIRTYQKDNFNRERPQILKKQVDMATYAKFTEHSSELGGITEKRRQMRNYNFNCGAHLLGFINQVDPRDIIKDAYYEQGDLIGKTGVERNYEAELRGEKGSRTVLMDNFNRELGRYAEGKYDEQPQQGLDILLTIDADLQAYGELLMQNKRGSVVAIEPSTGEILAFVSAPSFDPALLTGSDLGRNYKMLERNDSLKPLLNRPLTAQYSPGSIFKMLQALAAMSEGLINEETHFSCGGAWSRNGGRPACHGAHGFCSLHSAIVHSCNAFFAENYYQFLNHPKYGGDVKKAYKKWREIMFTYGVGHPLGVDIPDEKGGYLPTVEEYDKKYKGRWGALTIYSNSIGQGEVLMTPLQMANAAALIANRGYYIVPHFVKAKKPLNGVWDYLSYDRVTAPNQRSDFEIVVNGMEEVVKSGTGTMARLDSIIVCGKTGTVENPPYEDHAVFIAFAPKDNPRIAIGVIVENAGFGGTWAAPISSLMIEKYLTGKIKDPNREKRILDAVFLKPKIVPKKH